jgi:hypothetical protein
MKAYRIVWEDEVKAREVEIMAHSTLEAGLVQVEDVANGQRRSRLHVGVEERQPDQRQDDSDRSSDDADELAIVEDGDADRDIGTMRRAAMIS